MITIVFNIILFNYVSFSAQEGLKPEKHNFSFNKINGKINKNSAQRGLQVYIEVCSGCHGLKHVAYRSLQELGYNKDQINKIAAQFFLDDLPNDDGEIVKRKATYSDYFVEPYDNYKIAELSNNGAYPPDLSLMVKARKDGANYVRSLLLGYEDPPENFDVGEGYYMF